VRRLLALPVCALALAACGVSTTQQTFTPGLIRQVGAGSVAEAQVLPALQALRLAGGFSGAGRQQELYLAQGQLDKLTPGDLANLSLENQRSAADIGAVLQKLDQTSTSLTGKRVPATSLQNLPNGSNTFVGDWNRYLTATAGAISNVRQALAGANPVYPGFQRLLKAAYSTGRLQATPYFNHLRRQVLTDIGQRDQRVQNAVQGLSSTAPVEQKLEVAVQLPVRPALDGVAVAILERRVRH
jgi:hypothetical protein